MVDYAEIICQAVDEIVTKRLESVNYDNTITCSVVDISEAKIGKYTVTDGSTNFTAYSVSTEYKVNDVVYVTVPNNDFRNQKIIIGKQVTNDTTPFIFTTPFDTIVDVSANLITGVSGERNLIANNPDTPLADPAEGLDEYELHHNTKKLVWEKDFGNSMVVGFTRLGIQGQFRSWLKPYQAKDGDYGYHLILTCEKDSQETIIATSKRVLKKLSLTLTETIWGEIQTSDEIKWPDDMILSWAEYQAFSTEKQEDIVDEMANYLKEILKDSYAKYDLYLSSMDMYGDPYNFQSFYQQEKVFDISGLGKIINMKLEFYQTPETFLSHKITNQPVYNLLSIPPYAESWNQIQQAVNWPEKYTYTWDELSALSEFEIGKITASMKEYLTLVPYKHPLFETLLDPNLFEKDPYICVGYDLGNFDREQAILYTLDASTYRAGLTDKENTKQVQLRWLHKFDDEQIKVVSNETAVDFEVRWYRYELGHPTVDGYSGVNWKRVNQDEHIEVDMTKIVTSMKNYYLIYHDDPKGTVRESTYATGLKVPYKDGSINILKSKSISVLQEVDKEWLKKHNLEMFERNGFISPSYGMTTINVNLDLQSWTNIFKSQMIYHNADYNNRVDSFTQKSYNDQGCLHRVGFWELFTMAYLMYQYCPKEYDLLRVSSIWKKGGTENPIWTEKYANRNLYNDLGYNWPGTGDTSQNRNGIKSVLHEFANSFGEWDWYFDPEDNWIDYRPKDETVYNELYAAALYLYEKTQNPEYNFIAPNFSYTFLPDIEEVQEQVKAVIIYNDSPIYSNIITFENERPVDNPATLDQINGLNLWCADNSYGNYRIYNIGGYLEDEDDRNHIRDLECHFNSKEVEAQGLLHEATWIEWRVPATGTMLTLTSSETTSSLNYSDLTRMPKYTDLEKITWRKDVPFSIAGTKYFDGIWSDYLYDQTTDEIVSIWKGNSANGYFINPLLEYKIKSFYSPSDSNNTISCIVYKDGVEYQTKKEFTFGPAGNSGIDWSFEIDFDNNETALTSGNEKAITLTARLYDHTNKDVTEDILYDVDIGAKLKWSWHEDSVNPSKLTLVQDRNKKHKCTISIPANTTIDMNSLLYVQCQTENVGDYTLTAILPIPIRKWIDEKKYYSHVTGATYVVYPSSGYPQYYNNPFKVYIATKDDNVSIVQSIEKNGNWNLYNPHNESEVYVGNISDKNILKPAAIYSAGTKQYGLQYSYGGQVCWTQPIFTMQNNYPSRALNQWDGKEIKIDYDNGTIIAPAIAAGKKNADNTFSGVMLGDWSVDDVEADIAQQTGIYGFEHGAMSYAFKEDGTAFIGKSGLARIKFDGNESTIASESYTLNNYGMLIDLNDGFIDILGGHVKKKPDGSIDYEILSTETTDDIIGCTLQRKRYDPTGAKVHLGITGDPYFRIISDNAHNHVPLIEISNNAYYLQSDDYSNGNTGMFINLDEGEIFAHTFTLSADGLRLSTYDPYFQIDGSKKTLIYIGDDDYYLQSNNYKSGSNGMKIDLDDGSLYAYNFTLEADGDGAFVKISSKQSPYFQVSTSEGGKNLIYIGSSGYYLQSADYDSGDKGMYINLDDGEILAHTFTLSTADGKLRLSTEDGGNGYFHIEGDKQALIHVGSSSYYLQSNNYSSGSSGMHINLADGKIDAYNFTLTANGGNGQIVIDSAGSVPLKIGEKFQVSWDGVMTSDGAIIRTATIDDANINRGTITSATINTATINNAKINVATLSGQLTGTNWNIDPNGKATFGKWSFNNSTLSHSAGGSLSNTGGELIIQNLNGITLQGPVYVTGIGDLKSKYEYLLEKIDIEIAYWKSEAEYWEEKYNSHECPEPDSGGNGGAGSE